MCTNPKYIVHPSLNREIQYHNFDTVVYDEETQPFIHLRQVYRWFHEHTLPADSEIVRQKYYICDSTTGDCLPLFFPTNCGTCDACLCSKYTELASRLQFECLSYPMDSKVVFFTLTYSDRYLPKDGVCREHITQFINKLHIYCHRHGLGNFRQFIVSEYGTDPRYTRRPHYHGLIFGLDFSKFQSIKTFTRQLRKSWFPGCRIEWEFARSNHGVSRYVTKYVIKGIREKFVPLGKNPNFVSMPSKSGGLGFNSLKNPEILDKVLHSKDGSIEVKSINLYGTTQILGTQRIRIPRAIIDKLFPSFSRYIPKDVQRMCKLANQIFQLLTFSGFEIKQDVSMLKKFSSYFRKLQYSDAGITYTPNDALLGYDTVSKRPIFIVTFKELFNHEDGYFNALFDLFNYLLHRLTHWKYSIEQAVEFHLLRKNYLLQISNNLHRSAFADVGKRASFVSKALQDSPLDLVLHQ